MVMPPAEPDSPVLYYDEDEPELDGVRHLSVSSDGTIDSLISQDENPTPPQSPYTGPVVHISPPGAHLSSFYGDNVDMDDSLSKEKTPMATPVAISHVPFFHDPGPPTPGGIKVDLGLGLATPTESSPALTPVPGASRPSGLAARRAASGKLPNKALVGLQQMRFEASGDAGMGLGVGPGSAGFEGMEGVSPGGPGLNFRLQMGLDDGCSSSRPSSPLSSARSLGAENIAVDGTTPVVRRSPSNLVLKIPRGFGSSSSPLPSPSGAAPPSPLVSRSSAFALSNTGPRTPLTPSHLPPAPALGAGGAAFEWHSYSFPDSPGCPAPPPGVPVAERTCYFSDLQPSSPSQQTAYLPTPGSEKGRTPYGLQRTPIPASPLGQGRFASSAAGSNPFFA
ncbi:hypothetical protein JCM10450v2_000484 [Rhodotorula kratochvilovae]